MRSILEMGPTLNAHIYSVTNIPSFTIEEINIKSLNGGITKKFMSLASTATSFKWDFGDTHTLETTENPIYHTYVNRGMYTVSHQTCAYTGCCSGLCTQSIDVQPPGRDKFWTFMGLAGFVFLVSEEKCKKGQIPVVVRGKRKCVGKEELKRLEMSVVSRN